MSSPEQLTQKGINYLEKAILDVLFEAKKNGNNPFVRLVDMRRRLGTHNEWRNDNWLIRSLLYKLEFVGKKVEQKEKGGPWQLTDAEYNRRKVEIEGEEPSPSDEHDGVAVSTEVPSVGVKESASSPEKPVQGTEISPSKGC